ncbi:MAG TPA: ABC transporter substrate-binding protein [Jatrophihabitans sp.]|jgi:peptide/nickel transport system substrate-binding protein
MRRSRSAGVLAAGMVAALLAACSSSSGGGTATNNNDGALPANLNAGSGSPVSGGTLHMLGTGDVDYMDPNVSYYSAGYLALRLWSRQLLTYPAKVGHVTDAVPDLITGMPTKANGGISADSLTYKMTLRTGVKWNTTPERQVTAADVVRGLKRTCNPAAPFGGMPDFETLIAGMADYCGGFAKVDPKSASAIAGYQNSHDIAGVAVDPSNPLTVVFKLTHPASYFLPMLALGAFSPSPVEYDKYIPGSFELAQHTISDGPYKVSNYKPTKELDFVRNSSWDPKTDPIRKAYVDAVDISENGDQDAIQQQLKANAQGADMEWDNFPPVSAVPELLTSKDPNFNLQPTYSSNPYLVMNTVSPNNANALAKVAVRRAIFEAIDRAHLIQDDNGPQVSPPLTHILPAGISGTKSNTSPSYYPYDLAKAKKDLAAAGVSHLTLKFLYRPSKSLAKAMFLTVQQDLSKIGIKVVGVGVPDADFYTKYLFAPTEAKSGSWDMSLAGWGSDWYVDGASAWFSPLFYGNDGKTGSAYPPNGSDFGFYNSPAVNSLVDQATHSADANAANALWAKADKQVMDDAVIFPITSNNQPTYHASRTHNTVFIPSLQQIDPANVWLSNS